MRTLSLAALFVAIAAVPLAAFGKTPHVLLAKGKMAGTVEFRVNHAYHKYNQNVELRFTAPVTVGKQFLAMVQKGYQVKVATADADYLGGHNVRLIVGRGKDAMIIDRTNTSADNPKTAQMGAKGALRVQSGLEAYFIGHTKIRSTKAGGVQGNASVFRAGTSRVVDTSLQVQDPSRVKLGELRWLMKDTKVVTKNRGLPLSGYGFGWKARSHNYPTKAEFASAL